MPLRPMIESLEARRLLSTLPAGFSETHVARINTSVSATMAFAPDGRLFVGDTKGSQIRLIKNNALQPEPVITLSSDRASERGINGIAFAPNFATAPAGQKHVFVYYTRPDPAKPHQNPSNAKNRLSRFTISASNPDKLDPASEKVLIDGIDATAGNHNGGALYFGADGKLYLGVGEAAVPNNAQDLSKTGGKVLRINPDGSIPSDNPFVNTAGARDEVWAYGLRNPFTGAMKPGTSTLYINDVGQAGWEEVNDVKKGANYGWPRSEGASSDPAHTDPLYAYHHGGKAASITGGAFYTGGQFPSSYNGKYFFGDYILKKIWVLDPATKQVSTFASNTLMVVDLDVNPKDGSLWYLDLQGNVQKITATTGNRAPTAVAKASKTTGPAPLSVTFDATGSSDPDGDALTYTWNFGNGNTATGKTVTHTYAANGRFNAVLTVRDAKGASGAATPITIVVGNTAPVPKIELPAGGSTYAGGQTIGFKGSATDAEDGTLGASRFEWSVVFHHDAHTHPFRTSIPGVTSGSFVIPKLGELDANQFYRVTLTVTDSAGVKSSTSVDIKPRKSTFTLKTNIAGLKLELDGTPKAAPFSTVGVVGMTRTLAAPPTQTINGKTYRFAFWSDGKGQQHAIDTASTNVTYTATYREATATTGKTMAASAASYVRDGSSAGSNFGSAAQLAVKKSTAGFNRQAFLRFDLSSVTSITSAKLRLFGRMESAPGSAVRIGAYGVTGTWSESSLTWNNRPASGSAALATASLADATNRWVEWDLTAYLKAEKAAGRNVVSIALRAVDGSTPAATFASDEAASNKPQLVIA